MYIVAIVYTCFNRMYKQVFIVTFFLTFTIKCISRNCFLRTVLHAFRRAAKIYLLNLGFCR